MLVGTGLALCTLGVEAAGWIGLSMVAFSIDGRLVLRAGVVCRVVGTLFSLGGAVPLSNVTFLCRSCCHSGSSCLGKLFNSSSIFSSASICASPLTFLLPFNACVRSSNALTIVSAGVTVG